MHACRQLTVSTTCCCGGNSALSSTPHLGPESRVQRPFESNSTATEPCLNVSTLPFIFSEMHINSLSDKPLLQIFSLLPARVLAQCRAVCIRWRDIGATESLWYRNCVKLIPSLETDEHALPLFKAQLGITESIASRWRQAYINVEKIERFELKLKKTSRFLCTVTAYHVGGSVPIKEADRGDSAMQGPAGVEELESRKDPLVDEKEEGNVAGQETLPSGLTVERRFHIMYLSTFLLSDCSILYLEPRTDQDRDGYQLFVKYLKDRDRAGLAVVGDGRFIFAPPCQFTKETLRYDGEALIGFWQMAMSPITRQHNVVS